MNHPPKCPECGAEAVVLFNALARYACGSVAYARERGGRFTQTLECYQAWLRTVTECPRYCLTEKWLKTLIDFFNEHHAKGQLPEEMRAHEA